MEAPGAHVRLGHSLPSVHEEFLDASQAPAPLDERLSRVPRHDHGVQRAAPTARVRSARRGRRGLSPHAEKEGTGVPRCGVSGNEAARPHVDAGVAACLLACSHAGMQLASAAVAARHVE